MNRRGKVFNKCSMLRILVAGVIVLLTVLKISPAEALPETFSQIFAGNETARGTTYSSLSYTSPDLGNVEYTESNAAGGYITGYGYALHAPYTYPSPTSGTYGWVADQFILGGFGPPGTSVNMTATLSLEGFIFAGLYYPGWGSEATVQAKLFTDLTAGGAYNSYVCGTYTGGSGLCGDVDYGPRYGVQIDVIHDLSIPLSIHADTPVDITYSLWTLAGPQGVADFASTAHLSFDLPVNSWISSAGGFFQSNIPAPVPEPSILILLGSGIIGLVAMRKLKLS